ncbi:MAG: hypothetical protein RI894_2527, partial [Bacteroidota bacterium]
YDYNDFSMAYELGKNLRGGTI